MQAFLARSDENAACYDLEVARDNGKWNRVLKNIKDQLNFWSYIAGGTKERFFHGT